MYPLSPLFTRFRVWFVSRDVTMASFMTAPCKPCKLDIIDAVYQKSFEIVYIGAIYVFLVKQLLYLKQKNSK